MDNSCGSAIEQIKLQEQEKEIKLKEKRARETSVMSLNRAVRDTMTQAQKSKHEFDELLIRTDRIKALLDVEQVRRNALAAQVDAHSKELDELRSKSERGISKVWELRNSLCKTVQNVSDECDVWALLIKPACALLPQITKRQLPENNEQDMVAVKDRLKKAKERRNSALLERNRLLSEPETGEEFIRKYICLLRTKRLYSNKIEANENEPIKFSTSPAGREKIVPLIRKTSTNMPWYQPYSVVASVAVFLIYFCILREENDLDLEFDKTLYDRIKGLEKQQLLIAYKFNKEHGISVDDISKRLQEIETQEAQSSS